MKNFQTIGSRIIVALILLFAALSLRAQTTKITTIGEPLNFTGAEAEAIEPSAVTAIGDGKYLLVADDKADADGNSLAVVEAATGNVLKRLQIGKREKNPKWEGLARDAENNFYVVGSHFDDKAENLKARSVLYRFMLKPGESGSKIEIDASSVIELNIKNSLQAKNLYDENPLNSRAKIEGLAVRASEKGMKQLFVGLREPSDFVGIYAAVLPAAPKNGEELSLKPFLSFYAGKIQTELAKLSSIEYEPRLQGFLVLVSTENGKNDFLGNALWFVGDHTLAEAKIAPNGFKQIHPQLVWSFAMESKAEGVCVMPDAAKLRLAIVYDNDKKDTGRPGTMQFIELSSGQK